MKSENYFTLKEFQLNNNCPECYGNEGLQITFKQKISENVFLKSISNETKHHIYCYNCNTDIYPVRWDDDIERVVEYHKRAVVPKKKSWKLKPMAFLFIVISVLIILAIILVTTGVIEF